MGYELNKLMNQYGVSSPTLAYSGTAKPVKPTELATTASEADRQKYNDLLAKYNKDIPQYEADRAAYDKYKSEYQMRLDKTPMYGQKQFNTLANIPQQPSLPNPGTQAPAQNPVQAQNPENLVKNAYASIGRSGLGNNATQIDPEGYNYWLNQINTGAIKPEDFSKVFQGTVSKYLGDKPEDKYTQHINQFRNMQETGSYWNDPLKVPNYPVQIPGSQPNSVGPAQSNLTNIATGGMPSLPQTANPVPQNDVIAPINGYDIGLGNPIYDLSKKYRNEYAKGGAVKKYAEGGEVEDEEPVSYSPPDIVGTSVPTRSEMYLKLAAALAAPTKVRGMSETLSNAARAIGEFKQAEREGVQKDATNARLKAMQDLQNQKIQMELDKRKRMMEYNKMLAKYMSGEQPAQSQQAPVDNQPANPNLPAYDNGIVNPDLPEERNIPFADVSRPQSVQAAPQVAQTSTPAQMSELTRGKGVQEEINRVSSIIDRMDKDKLIDPEGRPASEPFRKQLVELYKNMPRYSLSTHPMLGDKGPVMTVVGDDSSIKELPYQPVKSLSFQDVGNMVIGKDTLTGKTVSKDIKGQTPDSSARISERANRVAGLEIDPSVLVDDDTATLLAQQALAGDTSIYTGLNPRSRVKVRAAVAKLAKDQGLNGADIAALNAEYGGTKASQRAIGTKLANTEMAGQEALNLMPIALEASAAVRRSGFLPYGKVETMFYNQTNNPDYRKFVAANNSLVNVYARAISPTGTPTDSDKQHGREMLSAAYDDKSYIATVEMMQKEIQAALAAPKHVKEAISKGIRGTSQGKEAEKKYEGFKIIGVK